MGSDDTKRKRSSSTKSQSLSSTSLGAVPVAFDHDSKRSKGSSSAAASTTRSKSKLMNTDIDDLPDVVLVDILSRLPCFDFVFKCKSVCKRWSILISDPYFIGRFLLRLQNQQASIPPKWPLILINQKGESFPITSFHPVLSLKFLTRVFLRLMSSLSLKKEPIVVGACNDLVLCCASEFFQRDYFICNPYTTQWVALPPPSRVVHNVPVGFICDPYYNYPKKDKDNVHHPRSTIAHDQLIHINVDYRCKVVRILPYDDQTFFAGDRSYKLNLEIFSFEIGEWRESIISFPRQIDLNVVNTNVHFAHNGMLYWSSLWGDRRYDNFLIGLDPFMISHTNNDITGISSTSNNISGRFIELLVKDADADKIPGHSSQIQCLGVPGGGGCLQLCASNFLNNSVLIWELREEEDDDLILAADGAGKLFSKHVSQNFAREGGVELIGFDPNKEGYLYARLNGASLHKINLRNGSLSYEIDMSGESMISNCCFFPLKVKPLWPTPVPRLPHQSATELKIDVS